MNPDRDFHMMRRNERAHFFSPKEQELMLRLYEEEREILTAKSNTTSASKLREGAWQRIADKINVSSDSGYKRTWQQVKVKHKNMVQTAKRRRAEVMRNDDGLATMSLISAEDDVLQDKDKLRLEILQGGACMESLSAPDSSYGSGPVLLLPVTKTEPDSLSSDETDVSDTPVETEVSSPQGGVDAACPTPAGRTSEKQTEDVRALYCSYLRKEMENRDQQMALRALKMKKLEKEILLLDKQLM
ncbi:GT1 domain-containing protein isoform X2 [Antennarius striatus]|uniref:GT1 domain-containing protein isoform X2 n=1 Tax=Antennarius striatus TaxID=241820 RepID=UPI0035AE9BF0